MLFAHFFRRELGNAGLASEKVDASAAFGEKPKESVCEIHARDLLLQRRFQDLGCQHHTRTVRQNEVGPIDERAQALVLHRLIRNFRIRRNGVAGSVPLQNRRGLV